MKAANRGVPRKPRNFDADVRARDCRARHIGALAGLNHKGTYSDLTSYPIETGEEQ